MAVHCSLSSNLIFSAADARDMKELDAVFVEVYSQTIKALLAVAYIPPASSQQAYKDLINLLEYHSANYNPENIIACGDFNLAGIVWDNANSLHAVQYVSPGVISSANLLRQVAILMDWC